jgi:hypothetical protein
MRTSQCLAINGDDLSLEYLTYGANLLNKAGLQLLSVQESKDPTKGVMRGDAMGQLKGLLEPLVFRFAKEFNIRPRVCATDRRTDGYDDDVEQQMPSVTTTRIIQV